MSFLCKINHVQVQTINWCNRSCPFCPSQKFQRSRELMSLETYRRVLSELKALGFNGRFSPYLMGEPLMDNRLAQLVSLARERLPQAKILIQTNGDALTLEKALILFEAGMHKLIINCYDNQGGRFAQMRDLAAELTHRIPVVFIKQEFQQMIRKERRGIRREIAVVDKTYWQADTQENWAGNVPGLPVMQEPLRRKCIRPFRQLYVHYNGNVVLCCCDWKGEVVFGNLNEEGLVKVYSSPVAVAYRENLARKNRQMKLCATCDYRGEHPWHDRLKRRLISFLPV